VIRHMPRLLPVLDDAVKIGIFHAQDARHSRSRWDRVLKSLDFKEFDMSIWTSRRWARSHVDNDSRLIPHAIVESLPCLQG
jgi:hypothetical protein